MTPSRIAPEEVGTPRYYELLRQEAHYWESVNRGEIDTSVATWQRPEVKAVVNGDLLERVVAHAAAAGGRILDLGCGNAWFATELARRGCEVDAVDIAAGRIRQVHATAAGLRDIEAWTGDVRPFVGDLNRLPVAPAAYDVVLAAAVLHHVLDLPALLDQVHRCLKPGGTLLCLDHMESTVAGRVLRYALLLGLPTEVPYLRKPVHAWNRLMARLYRRLRPAAAAPAAYVLPPSSPFEDISGAQAVAIIERHFRVAAYETHFAFADVVAGHLRLGSPEREVGLARRLRGLDDWLVQHGWLRGDTYFLLAQKSLEPA